MSPKRNLLALAIASACLGMCTAAVAAPASGAASRTAMHGPRVHAQSQQAQADTGQTDNDQNSDKQDKDKQGKQSRDNVQELQAVEVTGFASSIENSTALKRNANGIVEAVSAEQIGKLPGTSIADALGRLPGLAVQTVSGRPQVLTIHGMGPDFSTALINGGQQVSTSNNRDVQFDQYPSSWFSNVVVHLSPSANLIGQGLTGTVDMHTIRPLEHGGPEAAVNAHYIWNGMSQLSDGPGVSNKGYNVNGVWVHQFAEHTFGVTVGVNLSSNPSQIEHQAPWGYATAADGNLVVGGSKNYGISDSMKRNGVLTTLQWQPNEHFTSTFDFTYTRFKETQWARGIEFPLAYGAGVTLQPGEVSNGLIVNGTYDNVKAVIRNDYNRTRAQVYNFNWDNRFTINDNWSADLDASYSRANRRDTNLESYAGTGYGVGNGATDSIGFSEQDNGMLHLDPTLDYASSQIVLTDPQGWGGGATPPVVQTGFINAPRTTDYLANLRLSVQRSFVSGPISSVQLGVVRGTRNKSYDIDQTFLILPDGAQTAPMVGTTGDPLSWMGIGRQVIYNPLALIADGTYEKFPTALSSIAVPPNWKVRERDITSFLQFNLDTSLGNVGLRGNFGVQVAHTAQTSSGQRAAASAGGTNGSNVQLIPVSGGTDYTRYLPSANLVFGFSANDVLRLSAARVMARPRMDQMSASLGISGDITHLSETNPNMSYFSASGGNAKLLPTMAENYNVSYEHYFSGGASGYQCTASDSKASDLCRSSGGGYFALSGYFLKLHDYINPNAAFLYDFKAFADAYLTPAQQQQLGTSLGIVSGPTNDGHGYVRGVQATLNLPMNLLVPALDGFGLILTGDRTESSLVFAGNSDPITVPGLSKWVANGTLYYQHNGFQARVSDSYRSSFLGRVSGISATRIEQTLQGGSTYSAQVSYSFNSGRFDGLTLIAQGSNLSNKIFTTYQNGDSRQVQTWERYGRRFDVGVSYKF